MTPVLTLGGISVAGMILLIIAGAFVAIPLCVLAVIYLIVPFFKGVGWLIRQIGVFIFSTIADTLRLGGAIITSVVLIPLTLGNVVIGRWSASAHYGRAITAEFKNMGRCVYRLIAGNPARLLCLTPLTEGLERRIPEVMAAAPGSDRPGRRLGQFAGYEIVGSLRGGGSGGRLFVAKPDDQKLASFARNGHPDVDRVVVKSFSLQDGTTLPQIVRENRALDAAKKLGLILEHELTDERFYYVMRYVPGESLNLVTQRIHAAAGGAGLGRNEIKEVLSYAADLLRTLGAYHDGGLWHKDVKPDNVIVCDARAHLVDFGLVTPLRSNMTLTTHGTEYFRDPEMVRMALKGVKVHEVNGAKFDIYAVGAVLFSMVENSFPAHGGLSQISRSCPEAIRWIVRRAMTDYDKRYASATAMLADVQTVLNAADPFALRPAHLPSVAATAEDGEPLAPAPAAPAMPPPIPHVQTVNAGPYPSPAGAQDNWAHYPGMNPNAGGAHASPRQGGRVAPDIRVTGWMTGRYALAGSGHATKPASAEPGAPYPGAGPTAFTPEEPFPRNARRSPRVHAARASAADQLRNARDRAAAARQRARNRMHSRVQSFPAGINAGVVIAVASFFFLFAILFFGVFGLRSRSARDIHIAVAPPPPPPAPALPVMIDLGDGQPAVAAASVGNRLPAYNVARPASFESIPRAMVLCDWSKFDRQRQIWILSQIDAVGDAGFLLVGDFVPGEEDERGVEDLQAATELRAAVGTRPFLSPDARDSVRSWLNESGKADVVVWFSGTEPGKPDKAAAAWVVGSSTCTPEMLSAARGQLISVKPGRE